MKMRRLEVSQEEFEAIKNAEKKTQNKRVSRKLRVLLLRFSGKTIRETATIMDMSSSQVYRLVTEYRTVGLSEFIRVKYGGNHRSMSEEQENDILSRFEEKANAGQIVRTQEIKEAFDQARGKDTGSGYIYMLLKRHGWRKVMPRSKHPKKADDATIAASKKLTIP